LIGNDPSKNRSFPADESIRAFKSQVSSSLLGKSMLVLNRHSDDVTGLTDDEWLSLRRDLAATKGGRRRDPVNVGSPIVARFSILIAVIVVLVLLIAIVRRRP
jgi:hypothetical protein